LHGFAAVADGGHDFDAAPIQQAFQADAEQRVVVNDQDAHG
jgi:hypothetical protein